MNHRLKTLVFKMLDKLPRTTGDYFYHQLQRLMVKSIPVEYDSQMDTINRFAQLITDHGFTFRGKRVIEIGSGWLPVLPYELIFEHKASEVLTFDINSHFNPRRIRIFNSIIAERKGIVLGKALPDNVRYFSYTNILDRNDLRDIDVLITRNVLEHISPIDLQMIHKQAYSYLNDNGFIIHQISPSDHRAYTDRTLSLWDFLQYSEIEWNSIQTRFDYHNRLRLPQYIELFKYCGFRIRYLSYKPARPDQKLPAKIHDDFAKFSHEELTAGNINVILDKG